MHHKRKRRSLGIRTRRLMRILANRSWIETPEAAERAAANGLEAKPPEIGAARCSDSSVSMSGGWRMCGRPVSPNKTESEVPAAFCITYPAIISKSLSGVRVGTTCLGGTLAS
jgi:hypothetical protein